MYADKEGGRKAKKKCNWRKRITPAMSPSNLPENDREEPGRCIQASGSGLTMKQYDDDDDDEFTEAKTRRFFFKQQIFHYRLTLVVCTRSALVSLSFLTLLSSILLRFMSSVRLERTDCLVRK